MAEPLKNSFGPEIPRQIARMIAKVHPAFPAHGFVADALDGYAALELMPRGRKIAEALARHLPPHYPDAIRILVGSMEERRARDDGNAMAPFLYLPHSYFIAHNGLDHFEESMAAQHALTQRFTAEFCIRPFLIRHQERTMAKLMTWTTDPSEHVRRLVSEGTRPRLPWAARLPAFQEDPRPVLTLLERLRDDPSLYVRRSVANNLNDIGKDHPEVLFRTARAWLKGADENRTWLVRHALRFAVKRGDAGALAALGYGTAADVRLENVRIDPARPKMGDPVSFSFTIRNATGRAQDLLVDLRIHYVKSAGGTGAKVFKLREVVLQAGGAEKMSKRISTKEMTTRRHYPGRHNVDVLVNGAALPLGAFDLVKKAP